MAASTLFRLSGVAGIVCGLVILVQRLVIDSLVTGSPLAVGPLGPVLGLLVLQAIGALGIIWLGWELWSAEPPAEPVTVAAQVRGLATAGLNGE
ncbi:MAG TPA: hypothetical protein VFH48_06350 [Chloroflexota bacterium]|nr:hypothetical protein [Chloroflexota bacterium]